MNATNPPEQRLVTPRVSPFAWRTFLLEDDGELRRALASYRANRPSARERHNFWPATLVALVVGACLATLAVWSGVKKHADRTASAGNQSTSTDVSQMPANDSSPLSALSFVGAPADQPAPGPIADYDFLFGSIYYDGFNPGHGPSAMDIGVNQSAGFPLASNVSASAESRSANGGTGFGIGAGDVPAEGPMDDPNHDASKPQTSTPDGGSAWLLLALGLAAIGALKSCLSWKSRTAQATR